MATVIDSLTSQIEKKKKAIYGSKIVRWIDRPGPVGRGHREIVTGLAGSGGFLSRWGSFSWWGWRRGRQTSARPTLSFPVLRLGRLGSTGGARNVLRFGWCRQRGADGYRRVAASVSRPHRAAAPHYVRP